MTQYHSFALPTIVNGEISSPHVVIIGAGASKAACHYDKNGKEVPLLVDIHKVLGLTSNLKKYHFSIEEMENFEVLYSHIYKNDKYQD